MMQMRDLVEAAHCETVELTPSPIEPSWIIEGRPEARSHLLSKSAFKTWWTMIWSCTEGKFNWHYDFDETVVILEGSIMLEVDGAAPTRYGAGDVILFRTGSHAKWHVEERVKKVAFCRRPPLGFAIRAARMLKSLMPGQPAAPRLT
ncbi:cupin domain-containing protein [Bradyrhizobium huanghuaihaiense]|uniref:cupin domain-containing protein n=1 Tax=Bradyrhizobium huanghuaihaiense TaxID=990078 RepID=UPI0021AB041C|nr:cupin domain-containing protein [Bradyrhizobium sp. CB3035]UWU73945.1 cupin domain-containing protein [Bradyrhizobium sp. CB3035]